MYADVKNRMMSVRNILIHLHTDYIQRFTVYQQHKSFINKYEKIKLKCKQCVRFKSTHELTVLEIGILSLDCVTAWSDCIRNTSQNGPPYWESQEHLNVFS